MGGVAVQSVSSGSCSGITKIPTMSAMRKPLHRPKACGEQMERGWGPCQELEGG